MPDLDWDKFKALPGAPTRNWELLCRAAVRRSWASYGDFMAYAQQPGVEFHLRLTKGCTELGEPGRWWGWQCRWYDLAAGTKIGEPRRGKIKDAIETTEKWLPEVTDWVLWTRRALTPADQAWFYGLKTQKLTLHLRTEDELADLLTGDVAALRAAYFGKLVLTPSTLEQIRDEGVEPVMRRYDPAVHVKVKAEAVLEQVLGGPRAWRALGERATGLRRKAAQLRSDAKLLPKGDLASGIVTAMLLQAKEVEARLRAVDESLGASGPEHAAALASAPLDSELVDKDVKRALRALRTRCQPAALGALMLDGERRAALELLAEIAATTDLRVCAVVGAAGRGKSHLGIDLTAPRDDRPAGVYLQGRALPKSGTLDDLLGALVTRPQGTFGEVLEALDAAGARAGRRLPMIIDGLNEAEDPRRWRILLGSLVVAMRRHPNVLVVLTLRESVYEYAMPDNVPTLELPGFQEELREAVGRYFSHYRIRAGDVRLPWRLFRQPLFLRMFCEVANPDREKTVPATSLPASPTAVYERFRDEAVRRIATELLSCGEPDVAAGLDRVAIALWERRARALPFPELRELVDLKPGVWDDSIARALEDEGVLMRDPGLSYGEQQSGILFDEFAGYLIADALIRHTGSAALDEWLVDEKNLNALDTTPGTGHPLASDILKALAGVLPRRAYRQLWPYLDDDRRERALVHAADLEPTQIDSTTAEALRELVCCGSTRAFGELMLRLWDVRADKTHPLNARFTDSALRQLDIAERDLRWSEWIRRQNDPGFARPHGRVQRDVNEVADRWRDQPERDESDELTAVWLSWLLTATDRHLRDRATEALYWYGRGTPAGLFRATLNVLSVNDPYVPERLLAASFGVAMANQRPTDPQFEEAFGAYLGEVAEALLGTKACTPTSHWLIREYAVGAWKLAGALYPQIAADLPEDWPSNLATPKAPRGLGKRSKRGDEVGQVMHMDFENYTVGRLYEDRANYSRTHEGYLKGLAEVRARVWQLGWRAESFEKLDRQIAEDQWRSRRGDRQGKVDRYGKKYGWIAFYELAGRLQAAGKLPGDPTTRLSDLSIDPSFPQLPEALATPVPRWVRQTPRRLPDWLRRGMINVPDALLRPNVLDGHEGPWIAVRGYLRDEDHVSGRRAMGAIDAYLVTRRVAKGLSDAVDAMRGWSDIRWPEGPSDYYTFAGEIPWSTEFAASALYYEDTPYVSSMELPPLGGFDVEVVSHDYLFESYHSSVNRAGGLPVPSRPLSEAEHLHRVAPGLDHADADGRQASLVRLAPDGFQSGHVLYIREDVLLRYARRRRREVVFVVRGERQPDYELVSDRPGWFVNIAQQRADEWAFVRRVRDVRGPR